MAKEWAKKFYASKQWHKCRAAFIANRIQIDGGVCQMCHRNLGYIVDHVRELTPQSIGDPSVALNHGNLQYLCHECHNVKTFGGGLPVREGLMFDADGNLVEIRQTDEIPP